MRIPVKLKIDGFEYMGEKFNKGDIFDAPHEAYASFICEQEKQATRVNESDLEPIVEGNSMKRELKRGQYNTKVMEPSGGDSEPAVSKNTNSKQLPKKTATKAKSKVKANSDAASENT